MKTRVELERSLRILREAGVEDVVLIGRALPPWTRRWAISNNVTQVDDPGAQLGECRVMPASKIKAKK